MESGESELSPKSLTGRAGHTWRGSSSSKISRRSNKTFSGSPQLLVKMAGSIPTGLRKGGSDISDLPFSQALEVISCSRDADRHLRRLEQVQFVALGLCHRLCDMRHGNTDFRMTLWEANDTLSSSYLIPRALGSH